jgi:hypothetical protein
MRTGQVQKAKRFRRMSDPAARTRQSFSPSPCFNLFPNPQLPIPNYILPSPDLFHLFLSFFPWNLINSAPPRLCVINIFPHEIVFSLFLLFTRNPEPTPNLFFSGTLKLKKKFIILYVERKCVS